jgi:hypothetical protein
MAGKNTAVYGIFRTRAQAEECVELFTRDGFRSDDISVLMADNTGTKDFAHEKKTKAPEGTAAGVVAGGIVGGTAGLLAGLGTLAIPGVGPLLAVGPIVAALAGVGAGGTVGGLIGALIGLGIPEFEAKRYDGLIKEGRVLISVHCDNSEWVHRAKILMERAGGQHVSSKTESSSDYVPSARPHVRQGGGRM